LIDDEDEDDFLEQLVELIWQGKPKYSEETSPGATLSTTKSHMTTRSGGKPATNRLSYGGSIFVCYFNGYTYINFFTEVMNRIVSYLRA
jgi:hypothetical protein